MEKDKLSTMFTKQTELQQKFGILEIIKDDSKMRQQYINQMLLACHEEVTEIMRETHYKNPYYMPFGWKKNQEFNEEKMKEEIIDLWHFVMNLSLAANMDADDFYRIYCEKNNINHDRQKEGY